MPKPHELACPPRLIFWRRVVFGTLLPLDYLSFFFLGVKNHGLVVGPRGRVMGLGWGIVSGGFLEVGGEYITMRTGQWVQD